MIRFRHVTKELFSSVTPFLLGKSASGAIARLHMDWLLLCESRLDRNQPRSSELLLDAEREDVVLSLRFIVNYRARPDDRRVT